MSAFDGQARAGAARVSSIDMVPAMTAAARHVVGANGYTRRHFQLTQNQLAYSTAGRTKVLGTIQLSGGSVQQSGRSVTVWSQGRKYGACMPCSQNDILGSRAQVSLLDAEMTASTAVEALEWRNAIDKKCVRTKPRLDFAP